MRIRSSDTWPPIVLAISLLATGVLASVRFGQSLSSDEATSVWFAHLPVETLLRSLCDPHPPGYYLLLKVWLAIGEAEAWLRVPSLLAGLLAVLLTYRIGKERCGRTCAGLAAVLLALHPLHSWYASEVRMYALVDCLGLVAVWLGWRLIADLSKRAVSWPTVLAYALAVELALWADFTAFLPLGLLLLIWIVRGRPNAQWWIALHVVVILPIVALWLTSNQLTALSHSYHPIFLAVQATSFGLNLSPTAAATLLQLAAVATVLISLLLAFYWRSHPFLDSVLAQSIAIGVWVALLAVAVVPRVFTLKRVLIVMLPYLTLVVAYVMIRWSRVVCATLTLQVIAAVLSLVTLQREPWREVVNDLLVTAAKQPPGVVWVDELIVPAFEYYWRRARLPDEVAQWAPLYVGRLPKLPHLAPAPTGALWVVTSETAYRHLAVFLPTGFHTQYRLVSEQHTTSIAVYHYERRTYPITATIEPIKPLPMDEWGLHLPSPLDICAR